MKNSISNIEVRLVTLKDKEKKAYGYRAEYEAEICIRRSQVNVVVDSMFMTVQVKSVSTNEPNMFENVGDLVDDRILLSDLLKKLASLPPKTISIH